MTRALQWRSVNARAHRKESSYYGRSTLDRRQLAVLVKGVAACAKRLGLSMRDAERQIGLISKGHGGILNSVVAGTRSNGAGLSQESVRKIGAWLARNKRAEKAA